MLGTGGGGGGGTEVGAIVTKKACVTVCCGVPLSEIVRVTVNVPALVKMCATLIPVAVEPSPKSQLKVRGGVPPVAEVEKVIWSPTDGDIGWEVVGPAVRVGGGVGGGVKTVIVSCACAV